MSRNKITDGNETLEHLVCDQCAGTGDNYDEMCLPCSGSGWIKKSKMFDCKTNRNDIKHQEIILQFGRKKNAKHRLDL